MLIKGAPGIYGEYLRENWLCIDRIPLHDDSHSIWCIYPVLLYEMSYFTLKFLSVVSVLYNTMLY